MVSSSLVVFWMCLSATIRAVPLPQTSGAPCPVDNAIVCSTDGKSFFVCNWGVQVPMGSVAQGTKCVNGSIIPVDEAGKPVSTMMTTSLAPISSNTANSSPPMTSKEAITLSSTTLVETLKSTSVIFETRTKAGSTSVRETMTSKSTVVETVTTTQTRSSASNLQTTHTTPLASSMPVSQPTSEASEPTSSPVAAPSPSATSSTSSDDLTVAQLLAIAPKSSTCSDAQFADECATADHAVKFINDAFSSFGIATAGEKAALLSIMAFESGEFKFNINHFPGTPGQGTRNMMNFPFILSYASSIPSLASSIPVGTTADNASNDVKNSVRSLVLDDSHTFATAAWFLTTQCSQDVKDGLKNGVEESAWEAYITTCVGTTVTDARKAYWTAAVAAL